MPLDRLLRGEKSAAAPSTFTNEPRKPPRGSSVDLLRDSLNLRPLSAPVDFQHSIGNRTSKDLHNQD